MRLFTLVGSVVLGAFAVAKPVSACWLCNTWERCQVMSKGSTTCVDGRTCGTGDKCTPWCSETGEACGGRKQAPILNASNDAQCGPVPGVYRFDVIPNGSPLGVKGFTPAPGAEAGRSASRGSAQPESPNR